MIDTLKNTAVNSLVEGGMRTWSENNGKNLIENTADVFFEKGDRAIDAVFDPLIKVGGFIDDLFGW